MKNSTHVDIVTLTDGRQVCLSYGVIVAAFIPRFADRPTTTEQGKLTRCPHGHVFACDTCEQLPAGYLRTDARYSVTTSRHMNQFAGKDARTVPHDVLLALCAPVKSRE